MNIEIKSVETFTEESGRNGIVLFLNATEQISENTCKSFDLCLKVDVQQIEKITAIIGAAFKNDEEKEHRNTWL